MRTMFAAPIALLLASSALAQAPVWHVSEVSGDVRIAAGGQVHPAVRGAAVPAGAIVATAPGARAVLVRAHDYVVVSPASRIRVPTMQQQGGSGLIQMITDAGTAMFRIEHQSVPHFGVQTPYLAAVVKGTVFTVTVGERGASVQVTEGAVQVSTVDGGAADMIRPGMVATIRAADLQLLHVEGETSRDLRSNGAPSAGVVTVPAAEAGHYEGPSETHVAVEASVHEDPVSLADTTGGLVAGSTGGGEHVVVAEVHDLVRSANAGSGTNSSGSNSGSSNAGSGTNSGSNGGSGAGSGSSNGGSGTGNGGSGSGSGSGSSSAGSGNTNGGSNGGAGSGGSNGGAGSGGGSNGGSDGSSGGSGSGGSNGGSGSGGSNSGSDGSNGGSGSDHGGSNTGTGGSNGGSGSGSGGSDGGSGSSSGNGGSSSGSGHGGSSLNVCLAGEICVGLRPPH